MLAGKEIGGLMHYDGCLEHELDEVPRMLFGVADSVGMCEKYQAGQQIEGFTG
jgi:hypothetical protein